MCVCGGAPDLVCHNVCVKEGRLAGLAGYFRPHRKTDRQLKTTQSWLLTVMLYICQEEFH